MAPRLPSASTASLELAPAAPDGVPPVRSERQRLAAAAQVLLELPAVEGEVTLRPEQVQAVRALARDYRLLLGLLSRQELPVCLFFGVWHLDGAGHALYLRSGRQMYLSSEEARALRLPQLRRPLDQGYAPGRDELGRTPESPGQVQGMVRITHEADWTIYAFWDRTGDDRFGSNAAFLVEGTWTYEDLAPVASCAFPLQWLRLGRSLHEETLDAWRLAELGAR